MRQALLALAVVVVGAMIVGPAARAAEITVDQGAHLISIEGAIELDDDTKFAQALMRNNKIDVVSLGSPGGAVEPALHIGRLIRQAGLASVVPVGVTCASACGIIWLAGAGRYAGWDSHLGFHVVFTAAPDGRKAPSGPGSGVVGAYFSSLGASDSAILYLLQAPPEEMIWLTIDIAHQIGLPFTLIKADEALAARDRIANGFEVDRETAIKAAATTIEQSPSAPRPPAVPEPIAPSPPLATPSPAPLAPALQLARQVCSETPLDGATLDAVRAALGSVPILTMQPNGEPPGCMRPVTLLRYDDADVLVVQQATDRCDTCISTLSAYVLTRQNMQLIKALPSFAALGTNGRVGGPVTPVRIGDDDAMAVESRSTVVGQTATTLDLYRFTGGGVVHLKSAQPILISIGTTGNLVRQGSALTAKGQWSLDDTGTHLKIDYTFDWGDRHGTANLDLEVQDDQMIVTSAKPFFP